LRQWQGRTPDHADGQYPPRNRPIQDLVNFHEVGRKGLGLDCNEALRKTVGLSYPKMVELAPKADCRHTLWQIRDAVADMFASVVRRAPHPAT
jgi:hypothetical protein